jgi:exosortase
MTSVGTQAREKFWPGIVCLGAGLLVFQFLGNSTRGYIGSASLFYWWSFQWVNPGSETQHGLLILGLSVWLFVRNLRASTASGSMRPAVVAAAMVGGLLLHALGFAAEQARVSILGLLVFVWGLMGYWGGVRWGRAAAFPLVFMLFAIPFNALDSIGFWLRMWVVGASASFAHAVGIPVLVNGTQLLSADGRYDYDVAAACSGVRSLVALSALALLMGYLRFRPRWLWAAMLVLCLPLIYLGNVLRIVTIIVAAQAGGSIWGDRMHEVMGFGVFAIVLGGLFLAAELVGKLRPAWLAHDPVAAPHPAPKNAGQVAWPAAAVAGTAVLTSLLLVGILRRPPSLDTGITLAAGGVNPVALPTFLGSDWIGRSSQVTAIEREVLPPDTGFSRKVYVSLEDPSKQAFLSIVLSGRDRTSIHRPELCLVGQGWTIKGSFVHRFDYPGKGAAFPSTVLRVGKEVMTPTGRQVVPQLFAYYFVGRDEVVATHWQRIMRDSWDRVFHARSDRWAYVVVQTGVSDGEDAALRRMQVILGLALPVFQKHA